MMTLRRSGALAASALLVAIFVAGATGAGSPTTAFAPSGLIEAGGIPCSFQLAKVDADENLDFAVANCYSDTVTVLLGDGAGHFRRAASSPIRAGHRPISLSTADFNGDGKTDIAVANEESKDVSVLLGNGSGGFGAAPGSPHAIAGNPRRPVSADLNGDGRADLAVPAYPNRLAILLGDGSGRFGPAPGSPIGVGGSHGPDRVTVADFDADGKPDLAISTVDPMKIAILLGSGDGSFRSSATISAGLKAVGDFNGDGKPDLAAATRASSRARYAARVLLGTGSGRFSPAQGLRMRGEFWSKQGVAADFNGDQKLDLAFGDDTGAPSLLLGDGRGRFRPDVDSPLPVPAWSSGAYDLAAADLNRDGRTELVLATGRAPERGGQYGLAVLWRSPSGSAPVSGGSFPGRRDAVFSTRAPIWELAADGRRAAAVTARLRPCGPLRIVVWTAPPRTSRVFNARCGGDAVAQIALGDGQVAWLEEGGGNDLELSVTVARLGEGKPKQIEFITNGNRAGGDPRGGWLGRLLGGGPLLAYDSWTITCDASPDSGCEGETPYIVSKQRLIRIVARRPVVVKRGAASYALAAVGGGRMAVESAGAVTVLAANGKRVTGVSAVNDDPPRAIALSRTRLAVLRTFTLDVYDPATGNQARSIALGPAASLQLAAVTSTLALLRSPRRLVLVRLSDGKLISVALRTKTHVDAKLTSAGLFYAYNVRRGRAKGRIVFEPAAKLMARF
jgi:hypothetical protein